MWVTSRPTPVLLATTAGEKGRSSERPFCISEQWLSAIESSGLFLDAIAEEPLGIDWVETQPMLEFLA
jgi:hypothetical protein